DISLDARLVTISDQLKELAARSPDRSPQRRNEPYRLAVSGIYARLTATLRRFGQAEAVRRAGVAAPASANAARVGPPWVAARVTPTLPDSSPPSTFFIVHSWRMALRCWRVLGCAACVARPTLSVSILRALICARIPRCMSARWASCSR